MWILERRYVELGLRCISAVEGNVETTYQDPLELPGGLYSIELILLMNVLANRRGTGDMHSDPTVSLLLQSINIALSVSKAKLTNKLLTSRIAIMQKHGI